MQKRSAQTIQLNGEWNIIYDYDNNGKKYNLKDKKSYFKYNEINKIEVPSCWETYKKDYEGVAWYSKELFVDNQHKNKCLRLHFEAVNYLSEVWLNGIPVGFHEGGYTSFEFDISDLVEFNETNFLVVKVLGPLIDENKSIDGISSNEIPNWRGALSAGIWQDVSLIISEKVYIENVFIQPIISRNEIIASFDITNLIMENIKFDLNMQIDKTNNLVHDSLQIEPGNNRFEYILKITNPILWNFDNPHLYWLNIEIKSNKFRDNLLQRFGMREFTFVKNKFYLNGNEIMIKAAFYEGLYPHTLSFPKNREFIENEIKLAKDANLNMLRPWRKPQPSIVYDIADEMGILFTGSIAVECMNYYPLSTPYMYKRIKNEFSDMVIRDRNHPSIVIWEVFNEIQRKEIRRIKNEVSLLGRKLDPTRIIFDESGGFSGAHLYPPFSKLPIKINDVHFYPGTPLEEKDYNSLLVLADANIADYKRIDTQSEIENHLLTNVSEVGYGSFSNLESNYKQYLNEGNPITPDYRYHKRLYKSLKKVLEDNNYFYEYDSVDDFCKNSQFVHYQGNKYMIEACILNRYIAGIMVHAFCDGDWIYGAGLIDIFRKEKMPYFALKEVFNNHYISIRSDKPNYNKNEIIKITRKIKSDKSYKNILVKTELIDEKSNIILQREDVLDLSKGINKLEPFEISSLKLQNEIKIKCSFVIDNTNIENTYSIYIVENNTKNKNKIYIIDTYNKLIPYLEEKNISFELYNKNISNDNLLVIASIDEKNDKKRFKEINEWVRNGGNILWLTIPKLKDYNDDSTIRFTYRNNEIIPLKTKLSYARGLWEPKNHIVLDNSVFEGLPKKMMDNKWFNISPFYSYVNKVDKNLCPMVSYDWGMGKAMQKNYKGVSEVYCASNLNINKYYKGKIILSTLRIIESINKDAFSQKIFINIINNWRNL